MAKNSNKPLVTIYELQPPNEDYHLTDKNTYDGDITEVIKNYNEQFESEPGVGIAYHYIKYMTE